MQYAGGNSRATGMSLQYKSADSDDLSQMKFTTSEDFNSNKKTSASWLAAMHKVSPMMCVSLWKSLLCFFPVRGIVVCTRKQSFSFFLSRDTDQQES